MSVSRPWSGLGVAAAFVLAAPAMSEEVALLPQALGTTQLYAAARSGLGLSGYDPVSLWLDPEARRGDPALEYAWGGFAWRFASEANRAAFRRDPAGFAPRLGGYDALGIAEGRIAASAPTIRLVRSDRLYLFRTEAARALFAARPDLAEAAEARWVELQAGLARD